MGWPGDGWMRGRTNSREQAEVACGAVEDRRCGIQRAFSGALAEWIWFT